MPCRARRLVQQLDERNAVQLLTVDSNRHALLEAYLHVARLVRCSGDGDCPRVRLFRRFHPRVLEVACLDAASPEVLVRGVGAALVEVQRDVALLRIGDLVVAGHAPLAGGRDDLQRGRERGGADIEPHLVVPLPRAAVRDARRPLLLCDAHEVLRDERPAERGRERVDALVDGARPQRRPDELAHELLARVHHVRAYRADVERALSSAFQVHLPAQVHRERCNVGAVLLLQPADGNGGVETPAVSENYLVSH